jgi:hypothetical protein
MWTYAFCEPSLISVPVNARVSTDPPIPMLAID